MINYAISQYLDIFVYVFMSMFSVGYPDLCCCTCDGTEITCDEGGLTYVPLVPQNTTHLTINNFHITSLDVFPSYPSMVRLDLENNRIRYICGIYYSCSLSFMICRSFDKIFNPHVLSALYYSELNTCCWRTGHMLVPASQNKQSVL